MYHVWRYFVISTDYMLFKLSHKLTFSTMLSCRNSCWPWKHNVNAELHSTMHSYSHTLFLLGITTFLQLYTAGPFKFQTVRPDFNWILIHCHYMQGRAWGRVAVKANAPQAVGFKCTHCNNEFGTLHGMDVHHRHVSSTGTSCADPRSFKSLSFSGPADMSTGILQQHNAATLGVSKHTPSINLLHLIV